MIVPHFFQSSEQTCGAACLRMLGAALGVAQDEATIAQYCGITELGCTVQDLVIGAHAMGLQAEMLPVFSWPAAIETLVQHVPFVAMIGNGIVCCFELGRSEHVNKCLTKPRKCD